MRIRGLRAAVGALAVLAAMTACSSDPEPTASSPAPVTTPSDTASISASPAPSEDPNLFTSTVAYVKGSSVKVYDKPYGEVVMTLKAKDVLTVPDKTPLVLLAKTVQKDGIEVYLPVRPNGTTGWVEPRDVQLYATDYQLDVFIKDHELVLSKGGEELGRYPIGTGRDELPTPGGVYFIRELLAPPNPKGAYGPYAYGLSGYSPVLDNFKGGDAVIGIHGTNDPSSIGKDVSHGCIRLSNDAITELVETWQLPLGTPVYIHD